MLDALPGAFCPNDGAPTMTEGPSSVLERIEAREYMRALRSEHTFCRRTKSMNMFLDALRRCQAHLSPRYVVSIYKDVGALNVLSTIGGC